MRSGENSPYAAVVLIPQMGLSPLKCFTSGVPFYPKRLIRAVQEINKRWAGRNGFLLHPCMQEGHSQFSWLYLH
jgi:hypothetical protein